MAEAERECRCRVITAEGALDGEQLASFLSPLDEVASATLERELARVRRPGFAVNDQETEAGLTAVRVAVPPAGGLSGAALSVAAPTVRYSADRLPGWATRLTEAAAAIARDLSAV
jgi:IclR family acetate operon transcriptional repressor